MNILVTGYKGFIGSHLYRKLIYEGYNVNGFEWGDDFPNVEGYDWVMHIGAISSTTETNIEKVMRQNYDFSVRLYEDCRRYNVNMQFSSSASIYGLGTNFNEDAPVDPRTPYAWSKFLFEKYMTDYPANNITVQALRYFNVYGSNEEHKGSQASPFTQFRLQAQKTGKIKLFENSNMYHRDFIPVETVVDYHLKFLSVYDISGVYNIGTGNTMSFQDVGELTAEKYNAKIEYIPMPENLKHSYQEYTCADMTKTNKTLDELRG